MVVAAAVENDPAAHELLRSAHETSYRFPDPFGGFAASAAYSRDGTPAAGSVEVRGPRDIDVAIDVDVREGDWIRQELGSMAGHRWPTSYDAGDGRWSITLGPDDHHPLGRLVELHDDPFDSSYRVLGQRIGQVNRRMGDTRFSITIQAHTEVRSGLTLPAAFTVTFWDEALGRMTRSAIYTDRYVTVDGISLPGSRRVVSMDDAGPITRELVLADHRLLAPAAAG